MKVLKEFIIPYKGLKLGKHHFEYEIDNTFFHHFDYEEFNKANVKVSLEFEKKTTLLELNFKVSGNVNLNCDLTNEQFNQDISDTMNLVVNFGDAYNDENIDILILPHGEYEVNVAQYIYELTVLAVPVKRIHPGIEDGTLDSDILEKLQEFMPNNKKELNTDAAIDPRWDSLKKLLTDK